MAYLLKSLFLAINKNAIGKIYMFINYCKTFNLYEFSAVLIGLQFPSRSKMSLVLA